MAAQALSSGHVLAVAPDVAWTPNVGVIVAVLGALVLYVVRWRNARAEEGPRGASIGRLALFCAGLAMVLVALVSPVDRLAEQLFVAHMVQHILLLDFAAILCILGLTKVILRPITRRLTRLEEAAGPFGHPAFGIVLYVGGMWLWHVPALYDAALEHPVLHGLEHLTFTVAGGVYWWHVLSPIRSRQRLSGMGPVAYMVIPKVLVGMLGIVLTFSPEVLYDFYERQPDYWGLSPLTDQAVGGLVMALEQSIVMGTALVALFIRMLNESERESQRAERYGSLEPPPEAG